MKFMGWTASQWAETKGYYDCCNQPPVPANMKGMQAVRRWWYQRRAVEPGEKLILMAEFPPDFGWAFDAIDDALKEALFI